MGVIRDLIAAINNLAESRGDLHARLYKIESLRFEPPVDWDMVRLWVESQAKSVSLTTLGNINEKLATAQEYTNELRECTGRICNLETSFNGFIAECKARNIDFLGEKGGVGRSRRPVTKWPKRKHKRQKSSSN